MKLAAGDAILHTQAQAWLGEALADKGERDAAFAVVARRWGASVKSRTAARAAICAAASGCPALAH